MPGASELNQPATEKKGKHIHVCGFLCIKMLFVGVPQAPTLTFFKEKLLEIPFGMDQTSGSSKK